MKMWKRMSYGLVMHCLCCAGSFTIPLPHAPGLAWTCPTPPCSWTPHSSAGRIQSDFSSSFTCFRYTLRTSAGDTGLCRMEGRWQMKGGGSGKGQQKGNAGMSSSSKAWLNEHVNDHWVKEAQRQGWRSRAAFKLLQLQEKDNLMRAGDLVIDLGSAPGSWSQVASKVVGKSGVVVASDLLEMRPLPDVTFIQGDFTEDSLRGEIALLLDKRRADVLLSDMAPNMSGNKIIDQGRHYYLVQLALTMATDWLRTGGSMAVKVFRGDGFDECLTAMSPLFREVHIRKPAASRGRSDEIFLVGLGFGLSNEKESTKHSHAPGKTNDITQQEQPAATRATKKKEKALLDDMYGDDDAPGYAW